MGQETTWGAFFQKIIRDDLPTQAAALAYCASLSLAPLIFLLLTLLSWFGLDMHHELAVQANQMLGPKMSDVITTVVDMANSGPTRHGLARWIGMAALLITASAVVVQMHSTLNQIFGPSEYKSQLKAYFIQRGLSLLVVIGFILLNGVTIISSAVLNTITNPQIELWGTLVNTIFTFISYTLTFTLILKLIPDCPPGWKPSAISGTAITVMFMLGKAPLTKFIGDFAPASLYGAAGSLILFLLWVYYSSVLIYLGAELAKFLDKRGAIAWSALLKDHRI